MFSEILVCLDGSARAEKAVPYAVALAQQFQSRLTFIRVVSIPSAAVPVSVAPADEDRDVREAGRQDGLMAEEKEAGDYLAKMAGPLEKGGSPVDSVIVRGTPGESIAAYADQHGTELIIIATRERGKLGRTVFGSVTDFLIHNARASVLSIMPEKS
jgi:nucleotide-binding universal stress UspA family protein